MYRYQVVNADNQILRFLTVSGTYQERLTALSGKVKHLYGDNACFLKIELVSEKYYKTVKGLL